MREQSTFTHHICVPFRNFLALCIILSFELCIGVIAERVTIGNDSIAQPPEQRTSTSMTVAVAMSGGVDSSVAAAILREQGNDVVGFTMQLWNQRRRLAPDEVPLPSRCCSLDYGYD